MFGCICGGAVEVGLVGLAFTGLSCVGTSIYNWLRRDVGGQTPAAMDEDRDESNRTDSRVAADHLA